MKRKPYICPSVEELDISSVSVICASPQDGGNEDIYFEDWGYNSSGL